MKEFFERHIQRAKGSYCENCGRKLMGHASEIAHIFEKSFFKSVSKNDNNVLYLCGMWSENQCHAIFDSTLTAMSQMKCFSKALEKYKIIRNEIKEKNKKFYLFEEELRRDVKWKFIDGYDDLYEIDTLGNIKSYHKGEKILKSHHDKDGYLHIELNNKGVSKDYRIHRLVAKTFIPNPENKEYINHINYIRDDNFYLNLEWVDVHENNYHQQLKNSNKSSTFVGVRLHSAGKWQSRITLNNKTYNLGLFESEFSANLAYEKAKTNYYKNKKLPKNK